MTGGVGERKNLRKESVKFLEAVEGAGEPEEAEGREKGGEGPDGPPEGVRGVLDRALEDAGCKEGPKGGSRIPLAARKRLFS
jgi:hypothetical protein